MPSFTPPITGTGASAMPAVRAVLDDTGHRTALIGHFTGTQVAAVVPIKSAMRAVAVDGPFAGVAVADGTTGRFWFAELTPLPTPAQVTGVLHHLGRTGMGMPRFYVAGALIDQSAAGTVDAGEQLATHDVYVGATLGPIALSPREWARALIAAMTDAGEDVPTWTPFVQLLGSDAALYVLDHTGQVPATAPFSISFDVALASGQQESAHVDDQGRLASAALFDPGTRIRLTTGPHGIPYHVVHGSTLRTSAEPDAAPDDRWFEPSTLPDQLGTLLCTDLDGWFGERPAGIPLARYHTGNRVEPLLDGLEMLQRLHTDLLRLDAAGGDDRFGAWLGAWAFVDFPLIPGDDSTKFATLVKGLHDSNVQIRLLASRLLNFDGTESTEDRLLTCVVLLVAMAGIDIGSVIADVSQHGVSGTTSAIAELTAIIIAMAASGQLVDVIAGLLETSKDVIQKLTPTDPAAERYALWARYPARFADNPEAESFPAGAMEDLTNVQRIGVWHHKMGALAVPDGSGAEYVGFVGGIDINDNRRDSWGHRWPTDYHDVHARLTGPAVADLFQTFYERYSSAVDDLRVGEGPAAPNSCPRASPRPGSGDTATQGLGTISAAGDDIVQIARTLFRPGPSTGDPGLWFAPDGEASIHDSILRAIESAREYIYIEDQFMAPPDSAEQGNELIEALEGAATRCKALIMVFPQGTYDKTWLYGWQRRNALLARVRQAWAAHPGHHFLPLIHARPVLGPTDQVASRGRTVLKFPIDQAAKQVVVTDGIRVPSAPAWAWVGGELMLVQTVVQDTLSGTAALNVVRGADGHTADVSKRAHEAGEPVTFSAIDDVFIHAKIVLVDDTYASIGSANMNRRGMFHDGEISSQTVPGGLRTAAVNPVRDIRCRIWADHLGLGASAPGAQFADPLAALPLFARDRAAGNPLVPYELLDDMQPVGPGIDPTSVLMSVLKSLAEVGADVARHAVWSTLIDPTTALDPFHAAPPFP